MDAEELYDMIQKTEDWELFIIDTIRKEKMNPWDIDILKLADGCLSRIKDMQVFDYRIPAKVVLSAAILLRMKSDTLTLKTNKELMQEYTEDYYKSAEEKPELQIDKEFPMLEPSLIRAPKRKVTVVDLLSALRKVLKEEEIKTTRRNIRRKRAIKIELPEVDITKKVSAFFSKIKTLISGRAFLTFFGILPEKTREQIVENFMPMLYLSNEGKIRLEQEDYKDDIKIYLKEDNSPDDKKDTDQKTEKNA